MQENSAYEHRILGKNKDIAVVELKSNVMGGSDALAFTSKLQQLAGDSSASDSSKVVIVDLHNVELMNSSGLGMLVSGMSTLKKHNISMHLAAVPVKVLKLLEMTHLNKVFQIFDTVEDAVSSW